MLDIAKAIAAFESALTLEELRDQLDKIATDLGFSSFNYVDAASSQDGLPFFLGTVDREWEADYIRNKFVYYDPVIIKARRLNTPFHWSWVNRTLANADRNSLYKKTMNAAREFGFSDGLNIPNHYKDNRGRFRSSCACFFYKDKPTQFSMLFQEHSVQLRLIMIYWSAQIDLVRASQAKPRGSGAPAAELPLLSGREQDVLVWASLGKTIAETAVILSISDATVVAHIKRAIEKLGAVNKVQAVVQALRMGLIDP